MNNPNISIVIAKNIVNGNTITSEFKLKPEETAIITEPDHLEFTNFIPNETVFMEADMNLRMMNSFLEKIKILPTKQSINIKMINI
jgi:hypothetical protein